MACETFGPALHALAAQPLPPGARRAAERTLQNVAGTALGASRHEVVEKLLALALHQGGAPVAPLCGRSERLDTYYAALLNGTAASLYDFDDTQLSTVLHPGAAPFGAFVALAGTSGLDGARALAAFAIGVEASMRVALSISPWHYEAGWHITGTCGVIGAAVTSALLLGCNASQVAEAIGIASSETLGHREAFGSSGKTLHAGKAASNGVLAGQLARRGFTGTPSLDTPRGFYAVFAHDRPPRLEALEDGLGSRYEIETNTFKPYPCGIVAHPAIDAALELAPCVADPSRVRDIVVACHPLVVELTGRLQPHDGLAAIFSTAHGIAVALLERAAGLAQYTDATVTRADVSALRAKVRFDVQPGRAADSAALQILLDDGTQLHAVVEHARGSLARPLTDGELRAKLDAMAEPLVPGAGGAISAAVRGLHEADSPHAFLDALVPASALAPGVAR